MSNGKQAPPVPSAPPAQSPTPPVPAKAPASSTTAATATTGAATAGAKPSSDTVAAAAAAGKKTERPLRYFESISNNVSLKTQSTVMDVLFYIMICIVVYAAVQFYFYAFGSFFQTSFYRVLPIILVLVGGFLFLNFNTISSSADDMGSSRGYAYLSGSFFTFLMLAGLFYVFNYLFGKYTIWLSMIYYSLCSLILVGSLMISYLVFGSYIDNLKKKNHYLNFVIQFVYYIPCLALDFMQEWKKTPRIHVVLFFLEMVVLVVLYLVSRSFSTQTTPTTTSGGTTDRLILVREPQLLDSYTILASEQDDVGQNGKNIQRITYYDKNLLSQYTASASAASASSSSSSSAPNAPPDPVWITNNVTSNFSVAMWIYPNYQDNAAADNRYVEIWKYGFANAPSSSSSTSASYHPKFVFDTRSNQFEVHFSAESSIKNVTLQSQRWHHIAFTYASNVFDFFLDGQLYQSNRLQNRDMPVFGVRDEITLGDPSRSLKGWVVKEMAFFYTPLTLLQIVHMHNKIA